ncbi:PREDICTED: 39S ribosomal protein L41, mitochondrial [Gekko japonicus]|uniref:39S ribosomal protein L41, mitochondrial n=1 Tax=Gekko japonicus TaxID=146911 RepID=A0ABM1KY22_GEKJA|nr:PREDICTED: 39S ribosomal protein L41, mitochondrial [Gekko japonicus]
MGLLGELTRGLVRGADRMAPWTSKRGPRSFNKGRGAKNAGFLTKNRKFQLVQEMVPKLVVPDLTGFKLRPYVSYRAPAGSEPPLTARDLFQEIVAPSIKKDVEEGTFDAEKLEKYGFEPSQEGKLFKLFPKNFVR